MIGVGAAGAAVVAARLLPVAPVAAEPPAVAAASPSTGDGYQLTAHVQQYYATARV